MKKIKHSKFKNTGFIFELLLRQITSEIMSENKSKAEKILQEFFNSKKELSKELKLYQYLINEKYNSEAKAEKFIDTVCEARKRLDEAKLTKEKYNLVKRIRESYNIEDLLKSSVSNYKVLASIYKIFESINESEILDPTDVVSSRFTIAENIINKSIQNKDAKIKDAVLEQFKKQDETVRALSYKILIESFNTKYKDLSSEQKVLLREYINGMTNSSGFSNHIQSEVNKITQSLNEIGKKITDKVTKIKLVETIGQIKKIKQNKRVKEQHVSALMMAYELIKELKNATQK
jgi:hypothetical protein